MYIFVCVYIYTYIHTNVYIYMYTQEQQHTHSAHIYTQPPRMHDPSRQIQIHSTKSIPSSWMRLVCVHP